MTKQQGIVDDRTGPVSIFLEMTGGRGVLSTSDGDRWNDGTNIGQGSKSGIGIRNRIQFTHNDLFWYVLTCH